MEPKFSYACPADNKLGSLHAVGIDIKYRKIHKWTRPRNFFP